MENRSTKGVELHGLMTALVTPFRGGEVDWECWERLADRQIASGTDWLVPLGTTGETPTLNNDEQERLLDTLIARSGGRCPVMAGTGSNCTADAVEKTKRAAAAGANAALVVAPWYNRPTAEGLFRHFAAVAESVEIPIVLYNVPKRTGINIDIDVIVRLREQFKNIVAIKDATGTVDNVAEIRARCDVSVLCGDDALTWPFMALGAVGVISVLSNLVPSRMKSLVDAARNLDATVALQCNRRIHDLAMGLGRFGPNPLPIKTAMGITGLLEEVFRLPLCPLDASAREGIVQVLRRHEIIEVKRT